MRIFILIALSFIFTSCGDKNKPEFLLEGTTNGLENGTILYLFDSSKDQLIDSAEIQGNRFILTHNLPEDPFPAILKNKDNTLYKSLWLENKPMQFNAAGRSFEEAEVLGSVSELEYTNLYKAVDTLQRKKREKLLMDFINKHSDDLLGPFVLTEWYISWKRERTEPLFKNFSEKNKNSVFGKEIKNYIELNQNLDIGEKYVDIEATDPFGQKRKLSEVKKKLTLLEFWASWCAPCRKDNKNLVDYYGKYNDLGFEVFQVSLDDSKEKWMEAIKKDGLVWANVNNLKSWKTEAAMIYGVNLLPSNYLIDENGFIIARNLYGPELEQKIKELLE